MYKYNMKISRGQDRSKISIDNREKDESTIKVLQKVIKKYPKLFVSGKVLTGAELFLILNEIPRLKASLDRAAAAGVPLTPANIAGVFINKHQVCTSIEYRKFSGILQRLRDMLLHVNRGISSVNKYKGFIIRDKADVAERQANKSKYALSRWSTVQAAYPKGYSHV